jgi:hypothetical protein
LGIRQQDQIATLDRAGQQIEIELVVAILEEHLLAAIAALRRRNCVIAD